MNFKVKAWMIYFAGIVATPLIAKMIIQNNITPEELGSLTAEFMIFGGIVTGIYYALKSTRKKKEQGTK